ncbi:hypothetical protein D9M68_806910 [compost metagenome]
MVFSIIYYFNWLIINLSISLSDKIFLKSNKTEEAIWLVVYLVFGLFASIPFLISFAITIGSATLPDNRVNTLFVFIAKSL